MRYISSLFWSFSFSWVKIRFLDCTFPGENDSVEMFTFLGEMSITANEREGAIKQLNHFMVRNEGDRWQCSHFLEK
jgi:hypothetical protein